MYVLVLLHSTEFGKRGSFLLQPTNKKLIIKIITIRFIYFYSSVFLSFCTTSNEFLLIFVVGAKSSYLFDKGFLIRNILLIFYIIDISLMLSFDYLAYIFRYFPNYIKNICNYRSTDYVCYHLISFLSHSYLIKVSHV